MAVLNKYKDNIPADSIYIGRGSVWGNGFVIGKDGSRDEVCDKHERRLRRKLRLGIVTEDQLLALDGADLVCFCAPSRCHGHTLEKIIEEIKQRGFD